MDPVRNSTEYKPDSNVKNMKISNGMEPTQNNPKKIIMTVAIIILVAAGSYFLFQKYGGQGQTRVEVESAPAVNGVIAAPEGLPEDFPWEGVVTESATTHYPEYNAKQLSLSYQTPKTVAEKYAEYKNYMAKNGYTVTEGDPKASVRALFGTKSGTNLSVVISNPDNITLVQISYLLK